MGARLRKPGKKKKNISREKEGMKTKQRQACGKGGKEGWKDIEITIH